MSSWVRFLYWLQDLQYFNRFILKDSRFVLHKKQFSRFVTFAFVSFFRYLKQFSWRYSGHCTWGFKFSFWFLISWISIVFWFDIHWNTVCCPRLEFYGFRLRWLFDYEVSWFCRVFVGVICIFSQVNQFFWWDFFTLAWRIKIPLNEDKDTFDFIEAEIIFLGVKISGQVLTSFIHLTFGESCLFIGFYHGLFGIKILSESFCLLLNSFAWSHLNVDFLYLFYDEKVLL